MERNDLKDMLVANLKKCNIGDNLFDKFIIGLDIIADDVDKNGNNMQVVIKKYLQKLSDESSIDSKEFGKMLRIFNDNRSPEAFAYKDIFIHEHYLATISCCYILLGFDDPKYFYASAKRNLKKYIIDKRIDKKIAEYDEESHDGYAEDYIQLAKMYKGSRMMEEDDHMCELATGLLDGIRELKKKGEARSDKAKQE